MDRRDKAQDVFLKTEHFLDRKATFGEAFPNIESLTVEVEESDWSGPVGHKSRYTQSNAGEYIDCRNSKCYDGGFRLGQQLRFMVEAGETTKEDTFYCQGYDGSPKGRKRYDRCDHRFEVKITIVYRGGSSGSK